MSKSKKKILLKSDQEVSPLLLSNNSTKKPDRQAKTKTGLEEILRKRKGQFTATTGDVLLLLSFRQ